MVLRVRFPHLAMLLVALLVVALAACAGGLSEAEKRYNAGIELQEEGHLEDAIVEYDQAIRLDPQDTDAYVNRVPRRVSAGKQGRGPMPLVGSWVMVPLRSFFRPWGQDCGSPRELCRRSSPTIDEAGRWRAPRPGGCCKPSGCACLLPWCGVLQWVAPGGLVRGLVYNDLRQPQRAIQDLDGDPGPDRPSVLTPGQGLKPAYINRGAVYAGLGQPQRAIRRGHPTTTGASSTTRPVPAIQEFDEAIRLNPRVRRGASPYANLQHQGPSCGLRGRSGSTLRLLQPGRLRPP